MELSLSLLAFSSSDASFFASFFFDFLSFAVAAAFVFSSVAPRHWRRVFGVRPTRGNCLALFILLFGLLLDLLLGSALIK